MCWLLWRDGATSAPQRCISLPMHCIDGGGEFGLMYAVKDQVDVYYSFMGSLFWHEIARRQFYLSLLTFY